MLITNKSILTGKIHTMDLPITEEELNRFLAGAMVQDAFPNLGTDGCEFMLSGITPEEWEKYMPSEEE